MEELLKILGKINFYHSNIDDILHRRELDVFKHEWERVSFEISLMKDLNGFTSEQVKYTRMVKEKASKRIYEATGDSDLADCVYEDFAILSDGMQLGYKDDWFTKMFESYAAAVIPRGEL